jgi:hypothetical protein
MNLSNILISLVIDEILPVSDTEQLLSCTQGILKVLVVNKTPRMHEVGDEIVVSGYLLIKGNNAVIHATTIIPSNHSTNNLYVVGRVGKIIDMGTFINLIVGINYMDGTTKRVSWFKSHTPIKLYDPKISVGKSIGLLGKLSYVNTEVKFKNYEALYVQVNHICRHSDALAQTLED